MSWWIFNDYQSLFQSFLVLVGLSITAFSIWRNSNSIKTSLLHDMNKEERDMQKLIHDIKHKIDDLKRGGLKKETREKKMKILREEQTFLVENHLNFYEHLGLLIRHKKIKEKIAHEYYKDLLINTVSKYRSIRDNEKIKELLPKYTNVNWLYDRWIVHSNEGNTSFRDLIKNMDLKNWIIRIALMFFIGLVIPTAVFFFFFFYYGLSPNVYLTSGLGSVLAVLFTIIIIEWSKEKRSVKSFFALIGSMYVLLLIIGLSMNLKGGIPLWMVIEILYSSLFGFCIGIGISYVIMKKVKRNITSIIL